MSKYIPSISPLTESKLPHTKWVAEVLPFLTESEEEICFSKKQEQVLLSAVTGDKDNLPQAQSLFKGLGLNKKYRGYLFSYLTLKASKTLGHLVSIRDIMLAYKAICGNACHPDYPLLVANYGGFYVMPTNASTVYEANITSLAEDHVQNVTDLLMSVTKSKRKSYDTSNLQTLEELEVANKTLEKKDMEFVFQFAHNNDLLRELMTELQDSTPDVDLQRSVDLFAQNSMMYDFFSFMREKGISIA